MEGQIRLRWTSHQGTILSAFDALLSCESLVDVTLACEGQYIRAHKVILSACSPYFQDLINVDLNKHPIFFLKDVKFNEIEALIQYMYRGEINIPHEDLPSLLTVAQALKIRGLAEVDTSSNSISSDTILLPDPGNKNRTLKPQLSTLVTEAPITVPLPPAANSNVQPIPNGCPNALSSHLSAQPIAKKPRIEPRRSIRIPVSKYYQRSDPLADEQCPPADPSHLVDPVGPINEPPPPGLMEASEFNETVAVKMEDVTGISEQLKNAEENSMSQSSFPEGWQWGDDETSDQGDDTGEIPAGFTGAADSGEDSVNFSCPNPGCRKVYRCKGHLSRHVRFECNVVPHRFECICGTKIKRKDSLFRHQKNCDVFQQYNADPYYL